MKLTPDEKKVIIDFFELILSKLAPPPVELPKPEPKNAEPQSRYIPVSQWNQFHSWPSEGGLKHLLFHRHKNGLNQCVRKIGKRLVICEKGFFEWVEKYKAR